MKKFRLYVHVGSGINSLIGYYDGDTVDIKLKLNEFRDPGMILINLDNGITVVRTAMTHVKLTEI